MAQSSIELFQELRDLVIVEARSAREHYRNQLQLSVSERISKGSCLADVRFQKKLDNGNLRFSGAHNTSEFREGDFIIIHTGDPFHTLGSGIWVSDSLAKNGHSIIDLATGATDAAAIMGTRGPFTIDPAFIDLSPQLLRALEEMSSSERGRSRILPLFKTDQTIEGVDPYAYEDAAQTASGSRFNESQEEAVALGSSCDWCALIEGPPGTGKTRVLAQIVRERVSRGERILVTACTHRAIDEALHKAQQLNPDFERIAKVGNLGTQILGSIPTHDSFSDCDFEDSSEGYVVGATPYCAFSNHLNRAVFDCVIIDEASQMTLPLAVMAMLSADRYVVIGDKKQLPPVLLSASPFRAGDYGLFQRLSSVSESEMLNTTYRMNHEIGTWISENFYYGELEISDQSRDKQLSLSGDPTQRWLADTLSPSDSMIWIPTHTMVTRHYSAEEADRTNQILEELQRRGHPLSEVAVITPFRRQARLIRNRLQQNPSFDNGDLHRLIIDTVERMQGQERAVIIVSTAAADSGFLNAIKEFICLPARLNVIVSRAKVKVIVLASGQFLAVNEEEEEIREAIQLWKNLKNACTLVEV